MVNENNFGEVDPLSPKILLRIAENGERILSTFTKAGVAYLGWKSTDHWTGALAALIALETAKGGNVAGGAAGLAVLTAIGIANIPRVPASEGGLVYTPEYPWHPIGVKP